MATVPTQYANLVPRTESGELSPIQLALANFLAAGFAVNDSPMLVNKEFATEMQRFMDSGVVTPIKYDYQTGNGANNYRGSITGLSYVIQPDGYIYMLRKAEDCGPDENRTELVKLGPRTLAEGTFAYWGSVISAGAYATGGGGPWGTGGITSPYPRNSDSPGNPFTGSDAVSLSSYGVSENNSFSGSPPNPQTIGNYAGRGGVT